MSTLTKNRSEYESLLVFSVRQIINSAKALPQICSELKRKYTCAMYSQQTCKSDEEYYLDADEYDDYDDWEHEHMERRKALAVARMKRYNAYRREQVAENAEITKKIGAIDEILQRDTRRKVEELYRGGQAVLTAKTIDFSASQNEVAQGTAQITSLRDMSYADYAKSIIRTVTTPFDEIVRRYMRNGGWEKLSGAMAQAAAKTTMQPVSTPIVEEKANANVILSFTEIRMLAKANQISYEDGVDMSERLVNTIYHGKDWRKRKVSEIDEGRLLELMDDYAAAAQNEDVTYLRAYVHDTEHGLASREAILINLALRNADPFKLREFAARTANG